MNGPLTDQPRYYSFGRYLRQRFGQRVHKVTIDAGFTCPNRDGARGTGGCTFCNNVGFSPNSRFGSVDVGRQLADGIDRMRAKRKAKQFLAYYQAYTNTYAPVEQLKKLYDVAWEFPEVVGMAIGTRPDCVSPEIIDLLASYASKGEVWIEYGLQTMHDRTLEEINRLHTLQEFYDAMEMTRDRGLKICVHTILGLPGESREMMMETHRMLAAQPMDAIKIHLLHIMKNTMMAVQYRRGEIPLMSREEFVDLVVDVLEVIPPTVAIQRMHADAPPDVLVAPEWCLDKAGVLQDIHNELIRRDTWQGKALGFAHADIPSVEVPQGLHVEG